MFTGLICRQDVDVGTQPQGEISPTIGLVVLIPVDSIVESGTAVTVVCDAVPVRIERFVSRRTRVAAVGLAIQVLNADGLIRTSEREFVLDLAEALSVDRDVAADLVRDITQPSG